MTRTREWWKNMLGYRGNNYWEMKGHYLLREDIKRGKKKKHFFSKWQIKESVKEWDGYRGERGNRESVKERNKLVKNIKEEKDNA